MKVLITINPGNHSPEKIDKNELENYDYCFNFWQNAIFNIIDLSLTDGVCTLNKGYYSNYILNNCDNELLSVLECLSCTHSLLYSVNGRGRKQSFIFTRTVLPSDGEKIIPNEELNVDIINNETRLHHEPTGIIVCINSSLISQADKEELCYLIVKGRLRQLSNETQWTDIKQMQWDFRKKDRIPKIVFKNDIDCGIKAKILNNLTS